MRRCEFCNIPLTDDRTQVSDTLALAVMGYSYDDLGDYTYLLPCCIQCDAENKARLQALEHQPILTDEQALEIAQFEQACELEHQAVQTAQAHSILLYAVVGNRLAIPVRFLAPAELSCDWYSPRKFESAEQASEAFLAQYPGAVQISAEMLEEASETRQEQAGLSR